MPSEFYWIVAGYFILTFGCVLPEILAPIIVARITKTHVEFSFSIFLYIGFGLLALELGMGIGANSLLRILPSQVFLNIIQIFFVTISVGCFVVYLPVIAYRIRDVKRKRDIYQRQRQEMTMW
jgi:hypothetical protein